MTAGEPGRPRSVEKLLLTPEDAAEALSLGRTTVFQLIGSGALRSVRIGKCRRVPASALVELVNQLTETDEAQPPRDAVTSPS